MDAKPCRPLRNMRTFNDENALTDGPLAKTIHHRNKSSPALSTAAGLGGFKAAAKRTAFGDVSNIAATTRTTKEDGSNAAKLGHVTSKPAHTIHERKSTTFLRPAQRPISVSGLRNLLTGSNNNAIPPLPTDTQHKAIASNIPVPHQVNNVRKLLAKRNTTVFKDTQLDTVQESEASDPQKPYVPSTVLQHQQTHAPQSLQAPATEPQLKLPAPSTTIVTEPVKVPLQLVIQPLSNISDNAYANNLPISHEASSIPKVTSNDCSILSNTRQNNSADEVSNLRACSTLEPVVAVTIKNSENHLPPLPVDHSIAPLPIAPEEHATCNIPQRPEPEEYWEDEEDTCEEEGYVTARSFRSKGDNTTGGATTVLVPRMNPGARREIEAATQFVESTKTVEEIEDESFDTSMVAEYGDEIFEYMRQLEVKLLPNPHYMDNQHEIQWSMRMVLMDWLVQVHHRFNLLPETLFLCVNYIDRFLSCKVVSLVKLQLVGATAIFIAAKYEEINCPSVQEIVYMVDGGYTVDEILKAERFMLTMLQFELGWPGPMSFLRRISKADDYDLETRTLAKYFLEVTLMDERFIGSPPSFTAAASHCLARLMLRKGSWSPHHVYYSGYTYGQLKSVVQLLLECCEDPLKHHRAVFDKYCDKRYKRASVFVQNEVQKGFSLSTSPAMKLYPNSPTYAYYGNAPYYGV